MCVVSRSLVATAVAGMVKVCAAGVQAHRVAAERGEAAGSVVGYSVRLDTKATPRTRLLFCTTGTTPTSRLRPPSGRPHIHTLSLPLRPRAAHAPAMLIWKQRQQRCNNSNMENLLYFGVTFCPSHAIAAASAWSL